MTAFSRKIVVIMVSAMASLCVYGQTDSLNSKPQVDSLNSINGGKPLLLESSVVSIRSVRSSQDGDTLSYNAASYKVVLGADAEAMISKMPGISITNEGIEALGKEVRRIMIDGQEFFGDNVLTALKNIPADMIQQVEVINKMSDLAELTGVDDGNSYTAINIITKPEAREGSLTGRLYGGYGIPDKYIAGGNVNWIKQKQMFSLIGMSNNISKYNFTSDDIVGGSSATEGTNNSNFSVKSLPGLSSVHSVGANYSNTWFTGSYFFNCIDNHNDSWNDKMTLLNGDRTQFTNTHSIFNARNYTHKFESKITFAPGKGHRIIVRPTISIQDLANSRNETGRFRMNYPDGTDKFIRNRLSDNSSDRFLLKAGGSVSYSYRFPKRGRVLSASMSGSYSGSDQDEKAGQYDFKKEDVELNPDLANSYSAQIRDRDTKSASASVNVNYKEPVSRSSNVGVEYRFTYNYNKGDNLTYRWNKDIQDYLDTPDNKQSALNKSSFLRNTANLMYVFARKKISVTLRAGYEHLIFNGSATMPYEYSSERTFHNAVYSVVANVPVDKQNTIRVNARGRTVTPSVSMLQDVVNLNNMSSIRAGNPDIDPAYLHEIGVRYIHTNRKAGSTLSVSLDYTGSSNYFCDSLVIDSPDFVVAEGITLGEGNQYVKPINISGYYKIYGKVTYGFPVDFLRSNMNVNASMMMNTLPGMINAERVPVHRNWYSGGLKIDSNFSSNLNFGLNYTGRYVQNEYSGKFGKAENNYFSQKVHGDVKWIFWKGFTLSGSATFSQDISTDGRFNDRYIFCDFFIGKRLFKNKMGEISIGVNDIFNDGVKVFRHSVSASGSNDSEHIGIGRYFSVQFVWHLRHFRYKSDNPTL